MLLWQVKQTTLGVGLIAAFGRTCLRFITNSQQGCCLSLPFFSVAKQASKQTQFLPPESTQSWNLESSL